MISGSPISGNLRLSCFVVSQPLRLQLWIVCVMDVMVSCRAVLPGCLLKTCFLPQPQQSCESDAINSYSVCSPKIQQNVTNERNSVLSLKKQWLTEATLPTCPLAGVCKFCWTIIQIVTIIYIISRYILVQHLSCWPISPSADFGCF